MGDNWAKQSHECCGIQTEYNQPGTSLFKAPLQRHPASAIIPLKKSNFIDESIFMNSAETWSQSLPWCLARVISLSGKS